MGHVSAGHFSTRIVGRGGLGGLGQQHHPASRFRRKDEVEKNNNMLWARTARAAKAGAKLVSWTEAATMAYPEDEPDLLSKGKKLARQHEIELVLSYVVPISTEPSLLYENKARLDQTGRDCGPLLPQARTSARRAAVRGASSSPPLVKTSFGLGSTAICYDYDFHYIGRRHATHGVQLAVVPSSDWRGIDPTHTQMAAVRAIEGGFAVLRTTRMGLSAGIDSCGRMVGQLSANRIAPPGVDGAKENPSDRILMVTLPLLLKQEGGDAATFYGRHGDWLVYLCVAALAGVVGVESLS